MYWEHKHAKKIRGWNLLETCHSCDHGPCQCWQMALQDHQHGHQNSQKNNSSLSGHPQSVILGVSLNHFRCIDDWQEIMALNEWCSFQHERVPPAACVAEWAFIDFNMQIWKDFFLKAYISGTWQGIYKLYTCIWYDHMMIVCIYGCIGKPSDAPLFDYCLEKSSSKSTKLYDAGLVVQQLSKSSACFIQISVSLHRQCYMFVELALPDQIKLRCFQKNWRPAESGQRKVWCVDRCWLWHFNFEMFFAPGSRSDRIHSEYHKDWQVREVLYIYIYLYLY